MGIEDMVESYLQGPGVYVYSAAQWVADRVPVSLVDAAVLGLAAGAAYAVGRRRARPRNARIRARVAGALAGAALLLHAALPYLRPPLEERWRLRPRAVWLDERMSNLRYHEAQVWRLYDPDAPLPEPEAIAHAVKRVAAVRDEPAFAASDVVKGSAVVRAAYEAGMTRGFTNAFFFWGEVSVPGDRNFFKTGATAHEMAHRLLFAREQEAEFVAYLALIQDEDPRLRCAGHAMRAYAEQRSLVRDGYPVQVWLPPEIEEQLRERPDRSHPRAYDTKVYGAFLRATNQRKGHDEYTDGFLRLVYAWERKTGSV